MTWFTVLDTVVRRVIVIGVIVCALIVTGVTVGWCSRRDDVARERFGATVAERQAELGQSAAQTTADQTKAEADNAAQTGRNRTEIMNAPNASETAGDAGNVGIGSLCRRVQYRDTPRCVELRRLDRSNAAD